MKTTLWVTTAAAALIAGTTFAGAQTGKTEGGPSAGSSHMSQGASQKGAATEQKGANQQGAATEQKGGKPGMAQGREERTEKKGVDSGKSMGAAEKKGTETRKSMGAAEKKGTQGRAQTQTQQKGQTGAATTGATSGSVQLSQAQKTKAHDVVVKQSSARVENPDFSISVNTVIPRHVRLFTLPSELVTIIPQYRKYKYIIVGEEIVIIDPHTFRIVAII